MDKKQYLKIDFFGIGDFSPEQDECKAIISNFIKRISYKKPYTIYIYNCSIRWIKSSISQIESSFKWIVSSI